MRNNPRKFLVFILGVIIISVAYAASPASKEYVDENIAALQAKINYIYSS